MSNETVSADPIDPDTLAEELARAATVRELQRIRSLLTIAVLIGLTVACFFARDVLLPVILGLMVALTLSPVVRWASRRGITPPLTAAALVLSLAGILGGAGYAMSEPISNWIETAPEMGREVQRKLSGIFESVEKVQEASDQVEEMATDEDVGVQKVVLDQPGLLNSAASYAAAIGATLSVALVLALFILASGDLFYVKIVESYPLLSEKKRALRIVYGVERAISRYLLTITAINAGLGVVIFAALWALGLPNAFIWGFVAFVFNFLPFIGALAGTVLVGFYALVTLDTVGHALLMPAAYLAATSFEGQFVTPTILGKRLNMNTVSVFLTVVFWGWLWGIAGALMAVPFLVIVKVICDNIPSLRTVGSFLGGADTAVPEPAETKAA